MFQKNIGKVFGWDEYFGILAAFALVVVVRTQEDEAVSFVRHHIVDKDTLWPQPCQGPACHYART